MNLEKMAHGGENGYFHYFFFFLTEENTLIVRVTLR